MYELTLSKSERDDFDWVGHRYAAGQVADLLAGCLEDDQTWDDDGDIAFKVPENVAWEIVTLAHDEGYSWPCFASELANKMSDFCLTIV